MRVCVKKKRGCLQGDEDTCAVPPCFGQSAEDRALGMRWAVWIGSNATSLITIMTARAIPEPFHCRVNESERVNKNFINRYAERRGGGVWGWSTYCVCMHLCISVVFN